ncbi:MAG: mannan-binding lectin [Sphingomonas sp.]|uniref:mannan-binding lectin n=1 Tax=Sphingomonas sp. TaxID=28214 RepID=UPI0025ECC7C5|nr:mannan-binding lectin [Sphingomonas sp.]MBX3563844.1 mannan-binding lectin [Sphingomonas sp.]
MAAIAGMLVTAPAFAQNQPQTIDVNAGPIWNQPDANAKCPKVAGDYGGKWNGQWKTTVPGKMSVCGVTFYTRDVEAGPIWNQSDANVKCPAATRKAGGVWNGQWKTTVPGKMSVCGGRFPTA